MALLSIVLAFGLHDLNLSGFDIFIEVYRKLDVSSSIKRAYGAL